MSVVICALAKMLSLLMVVALSLPMLSSALAATYEYDGNGRLRSATNSSGDVAYYTYDDRGNLISIERITAQPSVSSFSPNHGPSGTQVRVQGSGFATAAIDNDVRFNGIAAPVLTAAAKELLVMVPEHAATGPISVTVNGVTGISVDNFQVSQLGIAPEITAFTPSAGAAGTAVTITGTNLDPYPGESVVAINGIYVPATYIDDVQAMVMIPPYVGSGSISVTTRFGRAVTSDYFYVLPVGTDVSTVAINPPVVIDAAPQPVVLSSTLSTAAYLFQGNDGDYLSIQASAFSSSTQSTTYSVTSPTRGVIASGTLSVASPTVHLPKLTSSRTYTIYFSGGASAPQFSFLLERNQRAVVDAGALLIQTTLAAQSKRILLSANAGDRLGMGITGTLSAGATITYTIYKPDGISLATASCTPANGGCDLATVIPETGTYTVALMPSGATTFATFIGFWSEAQAEVGFDGQARSMLLQPGQNGWFTFVNETVGKLATLRISNLAASPSGKSNTITVYYPDGTVVATWSGVENTYTFNLTTLTATGVYRVYVNPSSSIALSTQAVLVENPKVPIVIDGGLVSSTTTVSGETRRFNFTADQGDNLGFGITNIASSGATSLNVTIYRPDGTMWFQAISCLTAGGGCEFDLTNAPATGTYNVSIFATSATQTFSASVAIWRDATAEVLVGGGATDLPLQKGQNGWLTFYNDIAGQIATLRLSNLTTSPPGKNNYVTIYKPDGSVLTTWYGTNSVVTLNLPSLSLIGMYKVFIDPANAASVAPKAAMVLNPFTMLSIDAGAVTTSTALSGETKRFKFPANQGDNLGVGLLNLSVSEGSAVSYTVYKPNGTVLLNGACSASSGGCEFDISDAPESGMYSVSVFSDTATQSFSCSLSVWTDASDEIAFGGTPISRNLQRGQNGWFTFYNDTAGRLATLRLANLTTNPSGKSNSVTIYKPDGTTQATWSGPDAVTTFNINSLAAVGTYKVFIDPAAAASVSPQARLVLNPLITVTVGGGAIGTSTSVNGETKRYTFDANQGDYLGLGIADLISTGGASVNFTVYRPDGSAWTSSTSCVAANGGCEIDLANAPMTGTYAVSVFSINSSQTFSLSLAVSNDVSGFLSPDSPIRVNLANQGQNGRLTFLGVIGGALNIRVTPIFPDQIGVSGNFSKPVVVTVYKPDGTSLKTVSITQQSVISLTALPATGTYTAFIDPSYGVTADMYMTRDPLGLWP